MNLQKAVMNSVLPLVQKQNLSATQIGLTDNSFMLPVVADLYNGQQQRKHQKYSNNNDFL